MRRRRACGAGALVLALGLPAGAGAQAWSPAGTIAEGTTNQGLLQLSSLSGGTLLASWWSRDDPSGLYRFATRPSGGGWAAPRTLGRSIVSEAVPLRGGRSLIVAGGDPGTRNRVRAFTGTPTAPVQRITTIGHDNWDGPLAAADTAGRAVAVWTWQQPRRGAGSGLRPRVVAVAARTAAGHWGPQRRISPLPPPPPYGNDRGPQLSATAAVVAAGGRGTVVVAWQRVGLIEARVSRDGGRSFGRVAHLGTTTYSFPRIGAAVSGRGDIAVGWSTAPRVAGASAPSRSLRTLLAVARPGAAFGRTREVRRSTVTQEALDPAADQFGPRVAIAYGAAGVGTMAWQSGEGTVTGVRVSRFSAISAPGGTLFLPEGDARASVLTDVAAAAAGAVVVWNDVGSTGAVRAVRAVTWPGDGSIGTAATLGTGHDARAAFSGTAPHVVWLREQPGSFAVLTASAPTP